MYNQQLDNLINFSFNFNNSMSSNFVEHCPDYIYEKWSKYIGIYPNKVKNKIKIKSIDIWVNKWSVSEEDFENLYPILVFIDSLNQLHKLKTSDIVLLFEKFIGFSVSEINKLPYNDLHQNVINYISIWKKQPSVKRDYNLLSLVG
jgi:hypothetical protein